MGSDISSVRLRIEENRTITQLFYLSIHCHIFGDTLRFPM